MTIVISYLILFYFFQLLVESHSSYVIRRLKYLMLHLKIHADRAEESVFLRHHSRALNDADLLMAYIRTLFSLLLHELSWI